MNEAQVPLNLAQILLLREAVTEMLDVGPVNPDDTDELEHLKTLLAEQLDALTKADAEAEEAARRRAPEAG